MPDIDIRKYSHQGETVDADALLARYRRAKERRGLWESHWQVSSGRKPGPRAKGSVFAGSPLSRE